MSYFNPPAPCGAGPTRRRRATAASYFNPPAPCGAGLVSTTDIQYDGGFQSTRPLRGGTAGIQLRVAAGAISIHPPLAGRDTVPLST